MPVPTVTPEAALLADALDLEESQLVPIGREPLGEGTVAAMETLGARREGIAAAVGPCIAQPSYEVSDDFRAQFTDADERFFNAGAPGHWQFDLPGYVASRLTESRVGRIDVLSCDTYADPARFYSFRRATHRGEPTYGRQLSLIGLG